MLIKLDTKKFNKSIYSNNYFRLNKIVVNKYDIFSINLFDIFN